MKKREGFLRRTKEKIVEALTSRDIFLSKYGSIVEEFDEIINIYGERLEDMFKLYSGELGIREKDKFANLILVCNKNEVSQKEVSRLFGSGKANEIISKLRLENLEEEDLAECKKFAKKLLELYVLRDESEKYLDGICQKVCPNINYLCGPKISAKLIAHVGSLRQLALLPASTIQVLGAEKALFKHLKNRNVKPPKHGIIFQHAKISNSPKKLRGKLSRTLAAKIASAAKADAFTKRFIGEKLKGEFDKRFEDLMNGFKSGKNELRNKQSAG